MNDIPACYVKSNAIIIIITSALGSQSTIGVQEWAECSLGFQSKTTISHLLRAIFEKIRRTVVQAHHSASSRHTIRWSLLAASMAEHNRPASTKPDDSPVCAIEASTRRCRWAPEPGTVSVVVSLCV